MAEVMRGGSWGVGVSSIFLETSGKVAHPLLRLTMEYDKRINKKCLVTAIVNFSANNPVRPRLAIILGRLLTEIHQRPMHVEVGFKADP